jgi:hypothetical protein
MGRQIDIAFCRYAFGGQIAGPPNFFGHTKRDGIEDQASIFGLQETLENLGSRE